jgi:ATP-dependent helicase/nuclease subunit B
METNQFERDVSETELGLILAAVAEPVLRAYENENPIGYPLTWDFFKDQLTELIRRVVARDLSQMRDSRSVPLALEAEITARLPAGWPEPLAGLVIRGRMDRIDRLSGQNRLRVIDYKFKFGAEPAAQDRDLARAALRGQRLQPPFYSMLGDRWASAQGFAPGGVDTAFYYIAPRWQDGPLVTAEFSAAMLDGELGAALKKTVADLAEGIRQGRFYIQRGSHCAHCEVAEICRKNHPPSLWRTENDPVTRLHREIREKDPDDL